MCYTVLIVWCKEYSQVRTSITWSLSSSALDSASLVLSSVITTSVMITILQYLNTSHIRKYSLRCLNVFLYSNLIIILFKSRKSVVCGAFWVFCFRNMQVYTLKQIRHKQSLGNGVHTKRRHIKFVNISSEEVRSFYWFSQGPIRDIQLVNKCCYYFFWLRTKDVHSFLCSEINTH